MDRRLGRRCRTKGSGRSPPSDRGRKEAARGGAVEVGTAVDVADGSRASAGGVRADVLTFSQLRARVRALWNWRRTESELDDEIAFHLSEEADDRAAAGLAPAQARLAAKRDFGNIALIAGNHP